MRTFGRSQRDIEKKLEQKTLDVNMHFFIDEQLDQKLKQWGIDDLYFRPFYWSKKKEDLHVELCIFEDKAVKKTAKNLNKIKKLFKKGLILTLKEYK